MKNKIVAICVFIACAAVSATGGEKIRFAFLSPDAHNQANSAIYNGARDALSELSKKYGKDMSIEFFSADKSVERQISEMSKAYLDGFAGALLVPVDAKAVEEKVAELSPKNFPIVGIGARVKGAISYCGTDSAAMEKLVKEELKRLSDSKKVANYCYFYTNSTAISPSEKQLFTPVSRDEIESVRKLAEPVETYSVSSYSEYAKEHEIDIMRRDNYGEIFLNPRLLANMVPIKDDPDRVFAFCLGSLPQLDMYLSGGQLDSCVYDDWYGWGYFAMRTLAEKVVEKRDPSKKEELLKPLIATPKNVDSFRKDWARWLR